MSKSSYDIAMNLALMIVYSVLIILVIQRIMESRGFAYRVEKIPGGLVFRYSLGIYAGCVRVSRDWDVEYPSIQRKADGWEIVFPGWYSDKQMYGFLMRNDPISGKNQSHAKDLEVFKQVVLKNNDALTCIRGVLFTQDRRKTPRK